jgi:metal-sulfur cluster biosynthetic enzyme
MVTEDQVRDALRTVKDPELNLNVVDLGLVYDIQVEDSSVHVTMTLTSPGCPAGPQILHGAKQAVEAVAGVERAEIELTWTPFWTPERIHPEVRSMMGF